MALKTGREFEEPSATQFSIFLANRVGQLVEMLDVFAKANVKILGMSIIDSTDWAVNRVITANPDKTRLILKEKAIPFTESEVILVEVTEKKTVVDICGHLLRAEVSVHFSYPLMERWQDNPVMVFHVDDHSTAVQALSQHGVLLLNDADFAEGA